MKKLTYIYYGVLLPIRYLIKIFSFLSCCFFIIAICFTCFSINLFFENDIFKATPADLYAIESWSPVDNSKIYDKNGKVVSEQFNQYHIYLPYKKIPSKMKESILAIEDRKFWKHKGIDIFSILRAGMSFLNHNEIKQGASTITQQVVKNLVLSSEKTISRKVREIILSLYLESFVSKEKIFEIYCNSMFLGHGAYGVGAAAKRYFGKEVHELDYHETALIAGLFQSPGRFNPIKNPKDAKERQEMVLTALEAEDMISKDQFNDYMNRELRYIQYESTYGKVAPYFVDYVMENVHDILESQNLDIKDSGLKIYTTLNARLDHIGQDVFKSSNDIFSLMEKNIVYDNKKTASEMNVAEGALLAIDRKTGEIVTMIGGRNYDQSQFNRAAHALRAPGSVFKTIVYALGLEKGRPWSKQYYVTPITIGNYRPRTQQSQLFSATTLFESFYRSINSTAVLLGQEVGIENTIDLAKKLGVKTPLKEEAATFLGGSDLTMLDIGRSYLTMANDGLYQELSVVDKIEDRFGNILYQKEQNITNQKQVLKKSTSALIKEGLKAVVSRGTGYKSRHLSGKVAGKTGTSNHSKDNWFAGFTKDLVIVVWLGNDDLNSFRGNISASNTASLLWSRFAEKSIRLLNSGYLQSPRGLVSALVHPQFGHLDKSGIKMFFLPGTEPKESNSDLMLLEEGQSLRLGMNEL